MTKHNKPKYIADTETTTLEYSSSETHVWAWACQTIGKDDTIYGKSIDSLMQRFSEIKGTYYFHNLAFDGEFIVSYLLNHGWKYSDDRLPNTFNCLISQLGRWYQIEIVYAKKGNQVKSTKIYDSLKKIPFPVKVIADAFNIPEKKLTLNYDNAWKDENWLKNKNTKDYISHDVTIVNKALDITFDEGLDKMTIGGDAISEYKTIVGKKVFNQLFPQLTLDTDTWLRNAYKGGFTWANPKHTGETIMGGMVYDVNSLYPSTMYHALLPFGKPIPFAGQYHTNDRYPLYVQKISCIFELKPDSIPTIQIKHDPRFPSSEYLESSKGEIVTLYMTNVDMQLMFDHYNVYAEEYEGGLMFQGKKGMFETYINKWMYVKENSSGGKRTLAKLYLNNLYGKFGSNPDVTGKYPYLDDNGAVRLALKPQEIKDPVYLPIAVFTTAWARNTTIRTAQAVYDRILYCDTDSIHIMGTNVPTIIKDQIDAKKLGFWKHESTFGRGKFLRSKTYIEDIDASQNKLEVGDFCSYPFMTEQNKLVTKVIKQDKQITGYELDNKMIVKPKETFSYHIRAAGLQDKARTQVTWKNFEVGVEFGGNLGKRHVKGGIILVEQPFKIRKTAFGYGL